MTMLLSFMFIWQQADQPNALWSFLPFILIFVVLYFLMLRPQMKRQKEKQKMIEAVKKGDNVVTRGGVHGKVMGFSDANTVIIKVDDNVKLNVDKNAIEVVNTVGKTQ